MSAPLLAAAILLLSHGIAQAQPAPAAGPPTPAAGAEGQVAAAAPDGEGEDSDHSARLPSAGPAGPDWRTGHVIVTGKAGAAIPAGTTTGDVAARNLVSDGLGFGGSLGVGLSRHTVLALSGSYALLPGASACDLRPLADPGAPPVKPDAPPVVGCSGRSLSVGPEFVYHVAQGIAFDPWISFGASYRWSNLIASPTGQLLQSGQRMPPLPEGHGQYHGLDFLRIGLGGDFYPIPGFGLGGYIDSGVGTYVVRPDPNVGGRVYAFFEIGARIAFDPLRWNWSPARNQVGFRR